MIVLRRAAVLLLLLSLAGLPAVVVSSAASARPADGVVVQPAPTAARERKCANGRPTRNFSDPVRDARKGIDVTTLSVWNKDADQCYWTTVSGYFDKNRAQVFQAFYDTKRGRKGWEYQVFAYSNKDKDTRKGSYLLKKVRGGVQYVKCPVYSFFWPAKHQIGMGVPKTCLGDVGHVRVHVQLFDITKYLSNNRWRGYVDDAPNGKGYTALY